jgi:hypothetical protein
VRVINQRGDPMMPTDPADPPRRKEQESRNKLLLVFVGIPLLTALAVIVWLWLVR